MTVKIRIDVEPCAPAIPQRATARIEYGDDARREVIWTYDGVSHPHGAWSADDYTRETINYDDGSSVKSSRALVRNHSSDPMQVADAGPLIREIAEHVGSILYTVLAVDQPKPKW